MGNTNLLSVSGMAAATGFPAHVISDAVYRERFDATKLIRLGNRYFFASDYVQEAKRILEARRRRRGTAAPAKAS
jgi:hypothetical protein